MPRKLPPRVDPEMWERLWRAVHELSEMFGARLVFIGGVAVYLHVEAARGPKSLMLEFSHDGDFYISAADFLDLIDVEDVTANYRLHKHQLTKDGIEFDVYKEYSNRLRVRYEDVAMASVVIENVRVAALEHLLLLKLDAYADRHGSAKGRKDERDLIRIGYLLSAGMNRSLLAPYLSKDHVIVLDSLKRSPEIVELCGGNAHEAAKVRAAFEKTANSIAAALRKNGRRRR